MTLPGVVVGETKDLHPEAPRALRNQPRRIGPIGPKRMAVQLDAHRRKDTLDEPGSPPPPPPRRNPIDASLSIGRGQRALRASIWPTSWRSPGLVPSLIVVCPTTWRSAASWRPSGARGPIVHCNAWLGSGIVWSRLSGEAIWSESAGPEMYRSVQGIPVRTTGYFAQSLEFQGESFILHRAAPALALRHRSTNDTTRPRGARCWASDEKARRRFCGTSHGSDHVSPD
jgi:hypothetical protein